MEKINNEYYVSLELAKLLKKAGFDWETEYAYVDELFCPMRSFSSNFNSWGIKIHEFVSAPTLDVAQRWLREVKNIRLFVEGGNEYYVVESYIRYKNCWCPTGICHNGLEYERFNTYEEALEAGIKKHLKSF